MVHIKNTITLNVVLQHGRTTFYTTYRPRGPTMWAVINVMSHVYVTSEAHVLKIAEHS